LGHEVGRPNPVSSNLPPFMETLLGTMELIYVGILSNKLLVYPMGSNLILTSYGPL